MDKVLVIGGGGFLGSHTADALSDRGYQVTVFDREPHRWIREGQWAWVGDVLDREAVEEAMKGARYVYHFAGIADIGESKERPFETIETNVMGTAIALDCAVKCQVERFVYASTMYVYSPYGSFYRATKQASETIIEEYCNQFPLDYTLLRYGSLYGPRAQAWNGIGRYVRQVVKEGKMWFMGTGHERREYIHVRDAARLSVDILEGSHRNQAITVTGPQVLSSQEMISLIFEIAGVPVNVEYVNEGTMPEDHYVVTPYRYTPKQAKKIFPQEFIDLGEGVLEVIEETHREAD